MANVIATVAASLAALRRERGLTQADMARIIGTHRTSYSKMEAGQQELSMRGAVNLASEFGISVDAVLGRAPHPGAAGPVEPSAADVALAERLRLVDELDGDDRAVLLKLIDTFVSKQRFKAFVQDNIDAL